MRPEERKYLLDIQIAAERIQRFTAGKNFDSYLLDELVRSAVERQFGIIGEALARLDKQFPHTAGRIPERGKIIGFRNILIHGYAAVDDRLVWGVIENYLTALKRAVDELIAVP